MNIYKYGISICTVILVMQLHAGTIFAQDFSVSPEPSPQTYDMAYPGILPDHPLYFLKVARAQVMDFFTGQPLDKASFELLQSDKHLAAGYTLLKQNQSTELAYESVDTAQDYLEEAMHQTSVAKKNGMDIQEMCQKLKLASTQHTLMLTELEKYVVEKDKAKFQEEKTRAKDLSKRAATLRP